MNIIFQFQTSSFGFHVDFMFVGLAERIWQNSVLWWMTLGDSMIRNSFLPFDMCEISRLHDLPKWCKESSSHCFSGESTDGVGPLGRGSTFGPVWIMGYCYFGLDVVSFPFSAGVCFRATCRVIDSFKHSILCSPYLGKTLMFSSTNEPAIGVLFQILQEKRSFSDFITASDEGASRGKTSSKVPVTAALFFASQKRSKNPQAKWIFQVKYLHWHDGCGFFSRFFSKGIGGLRLSFAAACLPHPDKVQRRAWKPGVSPKQPFCSQEIKGI